MDLTEAKRLLEERERCNGDRIDIRSAIQRNLADQVSGLVAEVERLVAQIPLAAQNERDTVVHELERDILSIPALEAREALDTVIRRLQRHKDAVAIGKDIFKGHLEGGASVETALERALYLALETERDRIRNAVDGPRLDVDLKTGMIR